MGNSQSSPETTGLRKNAPKQSSHKLSKPRIGNPATAGLLSPNGLSSSTARFSNATLSNKALPLEPVLSPVAPIAIPSVATPPDVSTGTLAELPAADEMAEGPGLQKKESRRRSLFRSLSYQKAANSFVKATKRSSSVGPSTQPPAEKVDRAQSMTAEVTHIAYYAAPPAENWNSRSSMGSRRTSWNYDMNSYEAKRLLNLIEEPACEQAASMSDRNTVVSEATWKSSNPVAPQSGSTPISRANSDLSMYTPVRRRSVIQTPGVATRTRTLPSSVPRPNFRYSHPATPSMSRQQSFESIRSGVLSMPPRIMDPDSMPRVVTPSELEYQSIGAFKLGSLRITNGAASPNSPELEKKGKHGDNPSLTRQRTDYFSAAPVAHSETSEPLDDSVLLTIVAPQPRVSNLSPIAASFLEAETAPEVSIRSPPPPQAAETPAAYLEDLLFTPFTLSESRQLSPELLTTSKHTAIEDELFDDGGTVEFSRGEVLDVRLDPSAKSKAGVSKMDTQLNLRTVSRTDSGFVSAGSPVCEAPLKPLTKADSGYSSNVSLRSFTTSKSQLADKDRQVDTSVTSPAIDEQQPESPARESLERPAQPSRQPPPPPVPPKDMAPVSPSRHSGSVFNKAVTGLREARLSTPSSGRSRHTPSPINSTRSSETVPRSPESMPRTPRSAHSDVSTSALSIGSGSNRSSKLSRLLSGARRSTHGPPIVHITHALDKSVIPSIPQDVETKLDERAGLFPMTTKRLALKPQQSKDTLKTIFSVGSMEINLDAMNPSRKASPALSEDLDDDLDDHDESRGRHLVHSMQSSIAHAAAHIIPRKPITRKPVPIPIPRPSVQTDWRSMRELDNDLPSDPDLTDYLSISSSLGNNPYDAALKAMGGETRMILSPPPISGRAMSLSASVERGLHPNARKAPSTSSLVDRQGIPLPSPLLPKEPAAVQPPKKAKTPPPVSMMTRSNTNLRKPRSLRHHQSTGSLSRKSSRESVHSYPAAVPPVPPALSRRNSREQVQSYPSYQQPPLPESLSQGSLSRRNSREHVQSYPSYQQPSLPAALSPPPIPRMDPRRSMSFQPQGPQTQASAYLTPGADIRGNTLSRHSSMSSMNSGSRNDSLSSSSRSQQGRQLQRPASTQPYYTHNPLPSQRAQALRHRASYDGYSNGVRGLGLGNNPPSMSNGYTGPPARSVIDPRWGSGNRLSVPAYGKQDQYGVYPPLVQRGGPQQHRRGRSVGNHGHPAQAAPYRVLHSYNSPAYRNVPIWG